MEKIVSVLLVISLSVWGYILFSNAEFMQWAEGKWNFALVLWMGMSVLNVVGVLAALSIAGISWAGKSEEPVEDEEPAPVSDTSRRYKVKTGKDISHCPDYDTYLGDMELQDDRPL